MPDQPYQLSTKISWSATMDQLEQEFARWGVTDWEVNYPRGATRSLGPQSAADRTVHLTYSRLGHTVNLVMGNQQRAVDNLRVLYLAIEAMRLNERRGIGDIVASASAQLAAPRDQDSPYTILGIPDGATLSVAEAAYRAKARQGHPDAGGSAEQMKRLNSAITELRKSSGR
jgi:hypothetical protein